MTCMRPQLSRARSMLRRAVLSDRGPARCAIPAAARGNIPTTAAAPVSLCKPARTSPLSATAL
jgi:hypothetical protein